MRNFAYKLSLVVIFSTYLLLFYVAYLMFWPVTSFHVQRVPTPLQYKEYRQGDVVVLYPESCRYNNNPGVVKRVIRNVDKPGIAFGLSEIPMVARPNTCAPYEVTVPLPIKMPPGTYRIENYFYIETNILRTETYTSFSDKFKIIP